MSKAYACKSLNERCYIIGRIVRIARITVKLGLVTRVENVEKVVVTAECVNVNAGYTLRDIKADEVSVS